MLAVDPAAAQAGCGIRALLGSAEMIVDLAVPVDPERDHIRGPDGRARSRSSSTATSSVPYCGRAEAVIRELLADFGDLRYVWRHLPLNDVHPHAQLAAEASEAAADQGKFWEMHDMLLAHQDELTPARPSSASRGSSELDVERFKDAPAQAQGRAAGSPRTSSRPT